MVSWQHDCLMYWSFYLDGAATNKHTGTSLNTAKLDQESEELKHASLSMDIAKLIQKGRQDKGFTQKDLATVSIACSLH